MLITRAYFTGELSIVHNNTPALLERLDYFIEKYEPEFLKDVMGYSLYKAYVNGTQAVSVSARWTDLIVGAEYSQYGRPFKWGGLVTAPGTTVNVSYPSNTTSIVVGRGQTYDPVAGLSSVTIPPALVGKEFNLVQRSYGRLRADEFSVSGSTLTLLASVFSLNDTYFYETSPLQFASAVTNGSRSLIANYVYYMWMRDQATQSTSVGEVETKTENSARVSPARKMVSAWNEMVEQVRALWVFLDNNREIYPEWQFCPKRWSNYRTINTLGL